MQKRWRRFTLCRHSRPSTRCIHLNCGNSLPNYKFLLIFFCIMWLSLINRHYFALFHTVRTLKFTISTTRCNQNWITDKAQFEYNFEFQYCENCEFHKINAPDLVSMPNTIFYALESKDYFNLIEVRRRTCTNTKTRAIPLIFFFKLNAITFVSK